MQANWHPHLIAASLRISSREVDAAIRYIDEHKDKVMAKYKEGLELAARGNSPEVEVINRETSGRFRQLVTAIRNLDEPDPEVRRAKVARLIKESQDSLMAHQDWPQPIIVSAQEPNGR